MQEKNGRPVVLSGAKAFAQRLEADLLETYARTSDAAASVEACLARVAKVLESVESVRQRGTEIDLTCNVVGSARSVRLYLDLAGPLGRFADAAPPEVPKAKSRGAAAPPVAPPRVILPRPSEPLSPPGAPLVVAPLLPGSREVYREAIGLDAWGRLWTLVDRPSDSGTNCHYVALGPDGATLAVVPMASRDELLAQMGDRANGSALLPSLVATATGPLRIEHYDGGGGKLVERVGPPDADGPFSVGPELRADDLYVLGVAGDQLLRLGVLWSGKKPKRYIVANPLAGGKRTTIELALPASGTVTYVSSAVLRESTIELSSHVQGALVRETFDLEGALVSTRVLEVGAFDHAVLLHGGRAALVARGRELTVVRFDDHGALTSSSVVFELPPGFSTAHEYRARMLRLGGESPSRTFTVLFMFGADTVDAPRVGRGVLAFDAAGAVVASALVNVDGTLLDERGQPYPLSPGPWDLVTATGSLALLLQSSATGLAVLWR